MESIREAARGLVDVAVRTPLMPAPPLGEAAGVPVYLKLENRQPTGAFKLRGAWTAVRRLSEAARARGVITYSSGNHGQAVAFAAQRAATRAVIVMPEAAPAAKVEGVKRWGGEVVFAGTTSEDRYRRAMAIAAEQGCTVIPPYDHHDVIAGQGTVGLEIVEDLPDVAHVAVPVGGGGLAAGIVTALADLRPSAHVTGVEPQGAATLGAALRAGRPVRLDRTTSMADGLLPLSVGTVTFNHLRGRADAITVSETAIAEAVRWLRDALQVVAEPSGAVTTAAIRSRALAPRGPAVLVVSGGNIDPSTIARLGSS